MRRKRPSPALVLAVIALLIALAGSAVAGTKALTSGLTKAKVTKIAIKQANKAITARAPGLSVASAQSAGSAQNADRLDGLDSSDLRQHCPASTVPYAGVCFDSSARPKQKWFEASKTCGDAGGRLPTMSELEGFRQLPAIDLGEGAWVSEIHIDESEVKAMSLDDNAGISRTQAYSGNIFSVICVFEQS
jgi:hypothetical protein